MLADWLLAAAATDGDAGGPDGADAAGPRR